MAENNIELEFKISPPHYLDDEKVRAAIFENYPEISPDSLDSISKPKISNHPDELEAWEVEQRSKRVADLSESSNDQLRKMQMCLYEECFGVNSTPGVNKGFRDSLAPTPGGILSHGAPRYIINKQSLETVSLLEFEGNTARDCVSSLKDFSDKEKLAYLLAEISAPAVLGSSSYMSSRGKNSIVDSLLRPNRQPPEDVTTWALRLIKMVKECPELSQTIQDPELKKLIGINPKIETNLINAWSVLWREMSGGLLEQNASGPVNYKNPNEENTRLMIGRLLKIRLHPETQILFKYISPSGYLNDDKIS